MESNRPFHFGLAYYLCLVLTVLMSATSASAATASVSAAASHSLTLTTLGNACGVGQNENAELGDGTAIDRSTPVAVAQLVGALNVVSSGSYHGAPVKTDGSVWTWGYNGYGQLGSGNTFSRETPFPVLGLTNAVSVAVGNYHTLVLKSDGTVWSFGLNSSGQLGDGTTTSRTSF